MIKKEKFNKLFPKASPQVYDLLTLFKTKYNFSEEDFLFFLSNCAHESAGFTTIVENLNYSASGLLKTFKKYFNTNNVNNYARNPRLIANRVYANRMGNGNESSGDGWKYRGRAFIQITGKNNYKIIGDKLNLDLINKPELLEDIYIALEASFVWYDIYVRGKAKTLRESRRTINGGYNGMNEVLAIYNKLK